ncbi:MAG: FHA domain-containing protein, partial [Gammaproteobacteria bacterium]
MANPSSNTGRRCPSGRHIMDPGWEVCPYCDGERRSSEQTAYRRAEPVLSADIRKTTVGDSVPQSGRETKIMPGETSSPNVGNYGGMGDKRRIRGILISYTWHPQGDLFPVREGKNYIGAGTVNREPGDPECDIRITDDPKLSSAHALILCRQGRFEIVDLESTNGTFVNDEMIPIRGMELPDTAYLRTGSTVWTFMKVMLPDDLPSVGIPKTSGDTHRPSEPTQT